MASTTQNQNTSDPAAALQLAQRASNLLSKASSVRTTFPASLFSSADTPELWAELEQLLYACLRTGDDESAFLCLEQLSKRFGANNERVMAMRGLYQEAVATDVEALKKIVVNYNEILSENPMNVAIHKRRIALIKTVGRPQEAIENLSDFLDSFPTDIEAWCELSDLYQSQGCVAQSIFCLEEAIISVPNAWNLHARLGELEYMASSSTTDNGEAQRHLVQAVQRFSRSIELCDDYLRGFYGLKLASEKLLKTATGSKASQSLAISPEKLQKLSQLATSKLSAIVKDRASGRSSGVNQSEVIAAQALLNRSNN